jgi:hypothetical protein
MTPEQRRVVAQTAAAALWKNKPRGDGGMMTEQEAFAAGWHASRCGLGNEDVWIRGPDGPVKETHTFLGSETLVEVLEDEQLLAAWNRDFEEGCQAQFDEAHPPDQKPALKAK